MAQETNKTLVTLIVVGVVAMMVFTVLGFDHDRKAKAALLEKQAERSRIEEEQARIERVARAREAEKELDTYVSKLHPNDLISLGNKCVAQITEQMTDRDAFSWSFIDFDPRKFEDLEAANLMGLRMTAFGSEITGKSLVKPQLATIESAKEYLSNPVRFEFVTVSKFDSYGGLKERLDLTACYLTEPGEMSLREAGSFILQK